MAHTFRNSPRGIFSCLIEQGLSNVVQNGSQLEDLALKGV